MATPTDRATSEVGRAGRRAPGAGPKPRPRRPAFDKDQATLFLLTITLGLGLGAVVRIVQRSSQANAAAAPQLAAQTTVVPGYGTPNSSYYGSSQPSYVLPQRSYRARGYTRMS